MARRTGSRRPPRLLLHLDIDAFLASVAQLCEPGLIGRPVVVGTGVVASRSYEAKARGVETAMGIREALERCPELVLREGDAKVAARFRQRVGRIVGQHAPLVEMTSLDDLYADLSGVCPDTEDTGDAVLEIARSIREAVRRETGLSVSQGIGATRTLARLATTRAKPAGIYRVRRGEEQDFLDPLAIDEIPGIGRKTAEILRSYGITRVAELRLVGRELMQESFGKRGEEIYWKLRGLPSGESDRVVSAAVHGEPGGSWGDGIGTQISRETSLWEPTSDPAFVHAMLSYLVDRGSHALREKGMLTRRLDLHLVLDCASERGGPEAGAARERRRSPERLAAGQAFPEASACRETLSAAAAGLLERLLVNRCLVRKIGVCLSRLAPRAGLRQELLDFGSLASWHACRRRAERLDRALDCLRARHGFGAIVAGESVELLGKLAHSRDGFRLRTPSLTL